MRTSEENGEDDRESAGWGGSVHEKKAEGGVGSCQVTRPFRELGERSLTQTHPLLP